VGPGDHVGHEKADRPPDAQTLLVSADWGDVTHHLGSSEEDVTF
jgi:hypothetical protein